VGMGKKAKEKKQTNKKKTKPKCSYIVAKFNLGKLVRKIKY